MNRTFFPYIALLFLSLALPFPAAAQIHEQYPLEISGDIPGICRGCGAESNPAEAWLMPAVPHWGYGYTDLLRDLLTWSASPYVHIDSIGASLQNRPLWKLTITSPLPTSERRHTVFIHTRTHPNEVQTTWVVNEVIRYLLSENEYARRLREKVIFHIVPMYNPDGVELEYGRENANKIDLERDWFSERQQPESASLRREFQRILSTGAHIEVALNLHSAGACKRYFVFHDPKGTSELFAAKQLDFIEGVRSYFTSGIQPWNYNVTWDTGRPELFPESWWWRTQREDVMALTYEDMNCSAAGMYDSTAYAILHGMGDFLGVDASLDVDAVSASTGELQLLGSFPNPFTGSTSIRFTLPHRDRVTIRIVDPIGRIVATILDEERDPGTHEVRWDARREAPGIYLCQLKSGDVVRTVALSLIN
jgi:hypothetical protein